MKEIELDRFVQIIPAQQKVDSDGNPIPGEKTEPVKLWGSFFDATKLPEIILNTVCDNGITMRLTVVPTWSFKNANNQAMTNIQAGVSNVNALAIQVESGTKVTLSAKWKWEENANYQNPTRTQGFFGTSLPPANTFTSDKVQADIVTNFSSNQSIHCIKSGPVVVGNRLTRPTGEHSHAVGFSVTFLNKAFVGQIDTQTPDQNKIKSLVSRGLVNNKARTEVGVTNDNNNYWCYAYPKSLGNLTQIIMNGATPVLSAFKVVEVTVTNGSESNVPYLCYISNNKGAFTNARLAFS